MSKDISISMAIGSVRHIANATGVDDVHRERAEKAIQILEWCERNAPMLRAFEQLYNTSVIRAVIDSFPDAVVDGLWNSASKGDSDVPR